MKEKQQGLIIDWFIKCYKENKYPANLKITCYEDARKFRQFWYEHCELELDPAIDYYLALSQNETKTD